MFISRAKHLFNMANGLRLPFDYKENVHYSVRNMSLDKRTSMKPGLLYPIYFKKLYPGDRFDIDIATLLQTNPLITPLMGEFVLRASVYFEPDSNLYGWLDNNTKLSTDDLLTRKRHTISGHDLPYWASINGEPSGVQNVVHRGSLLDFVGIPPVGQIVEYSEEVNPSDSVLQEPERFKICADRLLTYMDIIRTYYIASQTESIPFFYTSTTSVTDLNANEVYREALDDFFIYLRTQKDGIEIGRAMQDSWNGQLSNYFTVISRGGLFAAQYEPDMLRNILYNVDTSKVNVVSKLNSDGNYQFSIDTLRFQNKLQRLVDRYDLSGGRFSSWLKTVWGSRSSKRMDIPQFLGTTSVIIDPNTVTATSNTYTEVPDGDDTGSVVGEMSGQINQSNYKRKNKDKNFSHYVHVEEPGTLCVIVSIVPKVDYCQGVERELREATFADDYKPQFAQLGYQDVPYSDYALIPVLDKNGIPASFPNPSTILPDTVVGKQIAWMHLMSDVNRLHGEFATGGEVEPYTLRRDYFKVNSWNEDIGNNLIPKEVVVRKPSYYIDPRDWNYPFAITMPTYDNFFLQVGFNIRAVRPIGKRFMPTLE